MKSEMEYDLNWNKINSEKWSIKHKNETKKVIFKTNKVIIRCIKYDRVMDILWYFAILTKFVFSVIFTCINTLFFHSLRLYQIIRLFWIFIWINELDSLPIFICLNKKPIWGYRMINFVNLSRFQKNCILKHIVELHFEVQNFFNQTKNQLLYFDPHLHALYYFLRLFYQQMCFWNNRKNIYHWLFYRLLSALAKNVFLIIPNRK